MFSLLALMFLIAMPLLKHLSIFVLWMFSQKVRGLERHLEVVKAIGKWAMVDVFCIAYGIFSTVSDQIVPGCVVMKGYYFMVVYLFLNYLLDLLTHFWIKRIIDFGLGCGPANSIIEPKIPSLRVSISTFSDLPKNLVKKESDSEDGKAAGAPVNPSNTPYNTMM